MRKLLEAITLLPVFAGFLAHGQSLPPGLGAMSPQERKGIGIEGMNEAKKSILNTFILKIANRAYAAGLAACNSSKTASSAATSSSGPAPIQKRSRLYNIGGGHWIQEND
ncbi:MAG: hypothetical protein WB676_09155 [Bryobacteraceae bacterium]